MTPNASTKLPTPSIASEDSSRECTSVPSDIIRNNAPKLGPEPTLLSRRQVDALYSLLEAVTNGLQQLGIPYILTGGSLLGAIRQHSILFCDDDIDLAILESDDICMYERAISQLPALLGDEYQYSVKPWEGGDRVRLKACSNVFLDVFVIRKYQNIDELIGVIGSKKNGRKQSDEYVRGIVDGIINALHSQGEISPLQQSAGKNSDGDLELPCPIWHFNTRKAIEMWTKEVYRCCELFPTIHSLNMGPVIGLSGPNTPVWLLKRAFGPDCFEVYYESISHGRKCVGKIGGAKTTALSQNDKHGKSMQSNLPPLLAAGGQWEQSVKAALSDGQYLPMQPLSKAKRRHTLHDKTSLFQYLKSQSEREVNRLREFGVLSFNSQESGVINNETASKQVIVPADGPNRTTVYMDGVFDLFHIGHLNAIQQCASLGDRVIIGITGDEDASGYKRRPVISQTDRTAVVKSLKVVDDVVCPCPLVVTKDFMNEWGIDLVVHGFANLQDKDRQREFFQEAMDEGKFKEIEYYSQLSTTDIIERIRAEEGERAGEKTPQLPKKNGINPKWFGAALAAATKKSASIPYDPFPLELRHAIEPHLRKATKKRQDSLHAVRDATGTSLYEETMAKFQHSKYSQEGVFDLDVEKVQIREKFLQACGLSSDVDLSRLHDCENVNLKDEMLFAFMKNYHPFQEVYDEFVRSVCCPLVASLSKESINEVYYQSFPCVRVVRPGDFSIGPHSDSAYGHHPCSINFYVPLTKIEGSASLFMESRPGSEDWHPIEGMYGIVKHFAGAICAHWTPENNTENTRVSLDFRIIPGPMFNALECGGKQSGGVRDVYREKEGYYSRCCCENDGPEVVWRRYGPLHVPDARIGFPWTKLSYWTKKNSVVKTT